MLGGPVCGGQRHTERIRAAGPPRAEGPIIAIRRLVWTQAALWILGTGVVALGLSLLGMLSFSDSGSSGVGSLGSLLLILWAVWLVVTISVVLLATLGHRRTRGATGDRGLVDCVAGRCISLVGCTPWG